MTGWGMTTPMDVLLRTSNSLLSAQKEHRMEKQFRALVEALTDSQLATLRAVSYIEVDKRVWAKIDAGDYLPLNEEERVFVSAGEKVKAIFSYRTRTKCELMLAKRVVEATSPINER